MAVEVGTVARAPWLEDDGQRHRPVGYEKHEWMPRPYAGRVLVERAKLPPKEPLYVQVVPGPNGTWQIVRVDLHRPFARGFLTLETARGWLARAVRAGVVPQGVVELEPMPERRPERAHGDGRERPRVQDGE